MKRMTSIMLIAVVLLGAAIYGTCSYVSSEHFRKHVAAKQNPGTQSGRKSYAEVPKDLVKAPIIKADLFKNGLAILTREVQIGEGTQAIDLDIDPIILHGSLSISPRECKFIKATREVPEDPKPNMAATWFELFADHDVTIELTGGKRVSGLVVIPEQPEPEAEPEAKENDLHGIVTSDSYYYRSSSSPTSTRARATVPQQFLTLKRNDGTFFTVNMTQIVSVESTSAGNPTDEASVRKAVKTKNVYRLVPPAGYTGKVTISYLTKGIFWAPSYKFNLLDDNKLRIESDFEICNALEDMDNVEVRCISGYPNLEMGNTFSPLVRYQSPLDFIRSLTSSYRSNSAGSSGILGQSSVMSNSAVAPMGASDWDFTVSGGETSETDMEYMPIGKLSLQKDGVIHIPFKTADTSYEPIIFVAAGNDNRSSSKPGAGKLTCRDAIRFTNPMDTAITTAPCLFYKDGKLLGQSIGGWIPSGKKVSLPITKTLNIFAELADVRVLEEERVQMFNGLYAPIIHEKTLSIRNGRPSPAHLIITVNVQGEIAGYKEGTPKPTVTPLEEVSRVNSSQELTWDITLDAGAAIDLVFNVKEYVRI